MDLKKTMNLSWDEFDELRDPRPDQNGFDAVVERAISRRGFLGGALAFGSATAVFGAGVMGSATSARAQAAGFAFEPIGIATDFEIHVPKGYAWKPLVRWGDALFSDALNHACLIDGARLSKATIHRFAHADLDQLGRQLAACTARSITRSPGSIVFTGMSGNFSASSWAGCSCCICSTQAATTKEFTWVMSRIPRASSQAQKSPTARP